MGRRKSSRAKYVIGNFCSSKGTIDSICNVYIPRDMGFPMWHASIGVEGLQEMLYLCFLLPYLLQIMCFITKKEIEKTKICRAQQYDIFFSRRLLQPIYGSNIFSPEACVFPEIFIVKWRVLVKKINTTTKS